MGAVLAPAGCAGAPLPLVGPPAPTSEDASEILSKAIQIRTVNPPGDEGPLVEYFASLLRAAGLETRLIRTPGDASEVGRGAIWAKLPGTGEGRPIILLSHLDVVPAEAENWRGDPFAGEIHDGFVWGRGAQDAKGVAVVHLLAMAELARREAPLRRDVIFLSTPDEETGGRDGAGYLTRERTDLLGNAGYLLTEGGGVVTRSGAAATWQVSVTEKSPCWLRLVAEGPPGHSSVPPVDTAVNRLVAALERVRRHETRIRVVPEVATMFKALAPAAPAEDRRGFARLGRTLARDRAFRRRFLAQPGYAALVRDTLTITVLNASPRTNVLAPQAYAHLDARLLPDGSCENFAQGIERTIKDPDVRVEPILSFPSLSSPPDTPLWDAISAVAERQEPDAIVIPRVLPGFTDAHWFRERGIVAYGFVPRWHRQGEQRGVHGPNERISIENLQRGAATLVEILEELDERAEPSEYVEPSERAEPPAAN